MVNIKNYKVAIIHDILLDYGGAERTLEVFLELFPQADLYTFFVDIKKSELSRFIPYIKKSSIFTKIQSVSKLNSLFSIAKLFSWLFFLFLDLKHYDLIISSSHSYNSKIVSSHPHQLHMAYLYTVPRYLYGLKNEVGCVNRFPINILFFPFKLFLRKIDQYSAQKPSVLVSDSKFIQGLVCNIYHRDSVVIYPPANIYAAKKTKNLNNGEGYYVFHSRLVKQKGPELVIKVCSKYNIKLEVIGKGYLENDLKKIAGETVHFNGWLEDDQVERIYKNARGLIYCSQQEDFGLVPVEAMSFGVPVLAFNQGGVRESVIDGVTGLFFDNYDEKSLYSRLQVFESIKWKKDKIIKQSQQFSKEEFKKKIELLLLKKINSNEQDN